MDTQDHMQTTLETGLRGVPVGYCVTSSVDPKQGLQYLGKPVSYYINFESEYVIYTLLNQKEPSDIELQEFKNQLIDMGELKKETVDAILNLPDSGSPMKLMATAVLIMGMIEGVDDYKKDGLNLISKIPHLTALILKKVNAINTKPCDPSKGYMRNFIDMIGLDSSDKALCEVMSCYNILHYDHGGGNLSCFTGKCVASGLEDCYGSMASALCALAGPRHGRANVDALSFLNSAIQNVGINASEAEIGLYIDQCMKQKQLVYGYGHAVLRVEDPRATILYEMGNRLYGQNLKIQFVNTMRKAVVKSLSKYEKVSNPYPNIDAVSGVVMEAAGFKYHESMTLLFGMSRVVGITSQIIYERLVARNGKGTPIVRPKFIYKAL
ncbi:citrate synthase [Chlamydiia bacterium]|nr:citrate synthase [Chlamydiia bacterium]